MRFLSLYRIALPIALAFALPGCAELFAPNGQGKTPAVPIVTPKQQDLGTITIRVVGDGKIEVGGTGNINVAGNSQPSQSRCECGCGQDGCNCNRAPQDLLIRMQSAGSPADAQSGTTPRIRVERREVEGGEITVVSPASFQCGACELAVSSLRALGVRVEHVKQDGHGLYPIIRNAAGDEYRLPDGYWRVGRDDVAAAKKLAGWKAAK